MKVVDLQPVFRRRTARTLKRPCKPYAQNDLAIAGHLLHHVIYHLPFRGRLVLFVESQIGYREIEILTIIVEPCPDAPTAADKERWSVGGPETSE